MNSFHIFLSIHIVFAIMWVGGVLFVGWGVYPATNKLPLMMQRHFLSILLEWTHKLFTILGILVILTGVALGVIFGPIRTWDVLWHTSYGNIWLSALIIALFTLTWGVFIGYKYAMSVISDDKLWNMAAEGKKRPLKVAFLKVSIMESVEVAGFLALILCMVLI